MCVLMTYVLSTGSFRQNPQNREAMWKKSWNVKSHTIVSFGVHAKPWLLSHGNRWLNFWGLPGSIDALYGRNYKWKYKFGCLCTWGSISESFLLNSCPWKQDFKELSNIKNDEPEAIPCRPWTARYFIRIFEKFVRTLRKRIRALRLPSFLVSGRHLSSCKPIDC